MSPKQKEIAAQLGISPSTVSRALRNSPRISDETKARVRAAARGLHLEMPGLSDVRVPDMKGLIGLIVQDITNPFYAELARGVESCAYTDGYGVVVCDSRGLAEMEKIYVYEMRERGVDAFLITPIAREARDRRTLAEARIPYLLIDAYEVDDNASVVSMDHVTGARLAIRHLLAQGHERIAFVAGVPENPPVATVLRGYESTLAEQGIRPERAWIRETELTIAGGKEATLQLLALPNPPTAALYCSDWMAIGGIEAVEELGKRVPDDFSIIGYDNIAVAGHLDPPLTTVSQNYLELGRVATRILLHERNTEGQPVHQRALLRPRLVVRESVSSPPAEE